MVRAGVLRLVLSLLVAVTVMAGPCRACADVPTTHAATAMADTVSGMSGCHHTPATMPHRSGMHFDCPHCLACGGVLAPTPISFAVRRLVAASPFALPAHFPRGLLTSLDTGPPRTWPT